MREAVHDLNNQLAVILNYESFVLEDTRLGDPRRDDLLEIQRAAQRARDVALELLSQLPAASD